VHEAQTQISVEVSRIDLPALSRSFVSGEQPTCDLRAEACGAGSQAASRAQKRLSWRLPRPINAQQLLQPISRTLREKCDDDELEPLPRRTPSVVALTRPCGQPWQGSTYRTQTGIRLGILSSTPAGKKPPVRSCSL